MHFLSQLWKVFVEVCLLYVGQVLLNNRLTVGIYALNDATEMTSM